MAMNRLLEGFLGGAASGASTGNPWIAAGTGLLGMFGASGKSPDINDILPKIDAGKETRDFMQKFQGDDDARQNLTDDIQGNKQQELRTLIASGIDPASAARVAESHASTAGGKGRESINDKLMGLRADMFARYREKQHQRELDRASYTHMQSKERSPIAEMLPHIQQSWLTFGKEGFLKNGMAGFFGKKDGNPAPTDISRAFQPMSTELEDVGDIDYADPGYEDFSAIRPTEDGGWNALPYYFMNDQDEMNYFPGYTPPRAPSYQGF